MDLKHISAGIITILVVILSFQTVIAEPENIGNEPGVVISSSDINGNLSENSSGADILHLLNQAGSNGTPASVRIIQVRPGAVYSPDGANPAPEALYLISGDARVSADTSSVNAKFGDTIVVPQGSLFNVENVGTESLTFITVLSSPVQVQDTKDQSMYKKSPDEVKPVSLGNETGNTGFSVIRTLDTNGDSLPLSYDLAVVSLPAEHSIGSHYLTGGEIGYILDGSGNVTIGCVPHEVHAGDMFYIPPKAVQEMTASSEMKFLLLTDPYYKPGEDFPVSSSC
nr:cupin domain-containing protein [uncultured Methanospirillum sp.]